MPHEYMKVERGSYGASAYREPNSQIHRCKWSNFTWQRVCRPASIVDSPAKGVWIIRTATIIPDNEAWLHEEKTLNSLKKAIAWAAKHPAKSSNPDDLPATKKSGHR